MSGGDASDSRLVALIDDLRALPAETSWVAFKENSDNAPMIGKLISALANAARLDDRPLRPFPTGEFHPGSGKDWMTCIYLDTIQP